MIKMKLKDLERSSNKNLYLLALSALVGIAAGLLASLYRLALKYAEVISIYFYHHVARHLTLLVIMFPILAIIAYLVTWLMKRYPMISGSGIPQVKGQLQGYLKPNWFTTAFAKFAGGTLTMLAGLSLGREGPSIQLGSSMGQAVAQKFAQTERHRRILIASGASAGLSAAFNAPLSGVMFVIEEVFKYFSPLILLTCMTSAIVADAVARLIFGDGAVFQFNIISAIPLKDYPILLILGVILGGFGAVYNWSLLKGQYWFKKIRLPYVRLLTACFTTGIMALVFPLAIGSGHILIEKFNFGQSLSFLCLLFIAKFLISTISYSSGAPGGIFFPLLVLGASLGAIFATFVILTFHLPSELFANFIILSMAGTFTAIVRAPMTGILLLVEMTGSFSHLLPLALVSLVAYIVADLLKSEPIYDSLLANLLATKDLNQEKSYQNMIFETIVQFDSVANLKTLSQLTLPEDCLLVSIHHLGKDMVPNGNTQLLAGDYLTFMINQDDEGDTREAIRQILSEP